MVTEYAEGDLLQILEDDGHLPEDQVSGSLAIYVFWIQYYHGIYPVHRCNICGFRCKLRHVGKELACVHCLDSGLENKLVQFSNRAVIKRSRNSTSLWMLFHPLSSCILLEG